MYCCFAYFAAAGIPYAGSVSALAGLSWGWPQTQGRRAVVLSRMTGMNVRKPNEHAGAIALKIPTNSATGRASYRSMLVIVIPVVVGSSPISHPKSNLESPPFTT